MGKIIELNVVRQPQQCTFQGDDRSCTRTGVLRDAAASPVGQVVLSSQPPEALQTLMGLLNTPPSGQQDDGTCRWAGRGNAQKLMCEGFDE